MSNKRALSSLNSTPNVSETPPIHFSDHDDSYQNDFEDIDGNVKFSPDTTLSGYQSLNYSLVGSSNDDDVKSSSSKKFDTDGCEDDKYYCKISQELNASCEYIT